eukprot:TRINITY_DN9073_c0_g3_i1.p1 TRINITY_DN9073_c0_g3~~TRINITY_DN9073_c0_g3_i1.p1  ORF type:complete len:558 (-),score=112.74 TRINITY_DN9073_c0_g3_i1:300-1973(-)
MPQIPVLQATSKRETGKKAQNGNIAAAKAVADIIRTTLGPRSMLKMILDASGSIVLTNDGNAILREIDVSHPAAKSIIDLSRTQDEEVGDGTTSVIVLAGEIMQTAEPFLQKNMHPTVICRGFKRALEDCIKILDQMSFPIDVTDRSQMLKVVNSCINTKFTHRFGDKMADLALDAVQTVTVNSATGRQIDIKKYAKVEKIPGGSIEECRVLKGVMFEKDVVNPSRMKRKIHNPRILLMDCPLEYKKGESQTNVEMMKEEDWKVLLELEEQYIQQVCEQILKHKPDVLITEKGMSDLAIHYFQKAGVSAIRRLRKTDNNRIARACGATIVHRADEVQESDIGTEAGLFEVVSIGDTFWTFIVDCKDPKACTIVLRGASKQILNEVERNLQDAMGVSRNIALDPRLLPGGGAVEMAVSRSLSERAQHVQGVESWPFKAMGSALEVIPRTLAQNCGANVIRTITKLRAKHAELGEGEYSPFGINGEKGDIADMREVGIWDPYAVKAQTIKTAVEAAVLLLRIDDILSGISRRGGGGGAGQSRMQQETGDDVDPEARMPE